MSPVNKILLSVFLSLGIGFSVGFFLANRFNRDEVGRLQNEIARLKASENTQAKDSAEKLTESEINEAIANAERNPADFNLQKRLGISLYRYAVMQNETKYLPEIEKILRRAASLQPEDFETLANVGNIIFDRSQTENEKRFAEARSFYQKALEIEPNNADILTDIGVTYFLEQPPSLDKALSSIEKAVQIAPSDEKTLANLAQVQISLGKVAVAEATISKLTKINTQNPNLADLQTSLNRLRNTAQKENAK